MLQNMESITLRTLQILHIFVLRGGRVRVKVTIFSKSKLVFQALT